MQRGNQEDDRHAEDQIARRKLGLAVHIRHAALVVNGNPLQLSNRVLEAPEHRQARTIDSMKLIMERAICWRIPRLWLIERGAASWQDGGKRSRWR